MSLLLERTSVVLVEPQNDINIGVAVRAARNFGVPSMRLVRPRVADPEEILVCAPRSEEYIEGIEIYDDLDSALADRVFVVGLTARSRSARWTVLTPPQAARALQAASQEGPVAVLFGREDSGLPNEVLDRCHGVVTIPTNPEYTSLNLGQAVLLMMWEIFRLQSGADGPGEEVGVVAAGGAVPMAALERLFQHAEEALEAVEFFKTDTREHILRSVRSVFMRAGLDDRELAIWHGIFREVPAFLRRKGLVQEEDQSSTKQ